MSDATTSQDGRGASCPAIALESVSIWTPARVFILQDIDWIAQRGERWALIGPNGSGKSTLLSIVGAMRHPSRGRAAVLGGTLGRVDMPTLRRRIGFVDSGASVLDWLTGEDVVLTGASGTMRPLWGSYSPAQQTRARELLALLGCAQLIDREIATCSQGERGRIRIARALMAEPELLLLDEPAVGLDLSAREALIAALDRLSEEQPGLTSVLVTHHLEELPPSTTHALLLREGAVISQGRIDEALSSESLTTCFGFPVECRRDGERWTARAPANWARP
jgi:iron complex transport system ATP-binding protein